MATEREQADRMTEEAAKGRQFPKPEGAMALGSIPLKNQDFPHHAGADPTIPDDRHPEKEEEESAETS
jgi:hypothetical protein